MEGGECVYQCALGMGFDTAHGTAVRVVPGLHTRGSFRAPVGLALAAHRGAPRGRVWARGEVGHGCNVSFHAGRPAIAARRPQRGPGRLSWSATSYPAGGSTRAVV